MIISDRRWVPLAFLLANLGGCSPISQLDTEGKLVDFGPLSIMGRYAMNVGSIDLSHEQERQFRVSGLPEGRDFLLSIVLNAEEDCKVEKSKARIAFKMTEEHGKTVIDEDRPLRDLVWAGSSDPCTSAYGYVQGKVEGVPGRLIITGTDCGNGTRFVSRKSAAYLISVRVYGSPADMTGAPSVKVFLRDYGDRVNANCP